jgi:hypothetical protein
MEFGRAFSFITQDAKWLQKVGIAALVMLIPIVGGIVVFGWALEITRRVINNDPEPLPDWNDFGSLLSKGFQAFVVNFVYSLPIILISACSNVLVTLGTSGNSDSDTITYVLMAVSVCIGCFSLIYGILIGLLIPAAMGNLAASGQLSAGFRFGEVIGLVRAAPGAYAMVLLGAIVGGIVASFGVIACFIGIFFTAALAMAFNAHLWGQAYNVAKSVPAAPTM